MKVLTAAQMREVDRRTIELGIPGLILMENAAHRVVEFLQSRFAPLHKHRVVVFCGKGNNGGDGLAVARQLHVGGPPVALHVLLAGRPVDLAGDAADNLQMLRAAGCDVAFEITPPMRRATLVIDALLGTGLTGPARGLSAEWIREINTGFPDARVVAIDIPSGQQSDVAQSTGDVVRAAATVTFTAPKPCHVLWPAMESAGELVVGQIGSPASLLDSATLELSEPAFFRHLFRPRPPESNKGGYGHALIIAGGPGKTGASAMCGLASLRAGAGLVTVTAANNIGFAPELMTEPLENLEEALKRKNVAAIGPGMGTHPETVRLIRKLVDELEIPAVVDADALNAIAGQPIHPKGPRVFTPHPGEMSRLTGKSVREVQEDRVEIARAFAQTHGVRLVLKGNRTAIAFADGRVVINPTGSPAMATGGTGDLLTGLITGLLAQFPDDLDAAVLAGVWLHGRAGELAARELGEKSMIATDLLRYLPEAMREVSN